MDPQRKANHCLTRTVLTKEERGAENQRQGMEVDEVIRDAALEQ